MAPRLLALASVLLYGLACALPALGPGDPYSAQQTWTGWMCLYLGLIGGLVVYPLLCWLPNPWLWTLWFRALRGLPTRPRWRWGTVVWTLAVLSFLVFGFKMRPLAGAGLWVASIALGAEAARRVPPRAGSATAESDYPRPDPSSRPPV